MTCLKRTGWRVVEDENGILILTPKNVHENFNARLREIDVRVGK
jgi:hypothetical protein